MVSAFIWVKLGLNVLEASKLGRPKWETVGLYTAPVLGLVIGASVAAGSLIICEFTGRRRGVSRASAWLTVFDLDRLPVLFSE